MLLIQTIAITITVMVDSQLLLCSQQVYLSRFEIKRNINIYCLPSVPGGGNAMAGGAGNGAVTPDGRVIGQGTGIAQAGPSKFII